MQIEKAIKKEKHSWPALVNMKGQIWNVKEHIREVNLKHIINHNVRVGVCLFSGCSCEYFVKGRFFIYGKARGTFGLRGVDLKETQILPSFYQQHESKLKCNIKY